MGRLYGKAAPLVVGSVPSAVHHRYCEGESRACRDCRRLMQRDDSPITERSFQADELHVWHTEEQDLSLKSWRRVGQFAFNAAG